MEITYSGLRRSAEQIAPQAAKLTDAQAAYFAGWVAGAVAMAKQGTQETKEPEKTN